MALCLLLSSFPAWQPALPAARPSPHEHSKVLLLRGGSLDLSLASLGASYAASLSARPILTKAVTSAAIFTLSDVAGQSIAPPPTGRDLPRTITSGLVGLFYFGPALHYWLEMISRVVPGFDLKSTLIKTLMGQSCFGPLITAVFFAASLVQVNGPVAGLKLWPAKVKQDLLTTWATGLCFWPFVDLICYSFVPVMWIPLGYNFASFLWTIWLSLQAARSVSK
ncbi:MAG: hypothetical protein SGPRY_002596 [Prymnesium sp.]